VALILADNDAFNCGHIVSPSVVVINTRNATKAVTRDRENIIFA
jgi:hypothetical protein